MTARRNCALGAALALAALLLLSGYLLGRRTARAPEPECIVQVDTLRIKDTILVDKPVPVEVRVVDTMLVTVADTIRLSDTVEMPVPVEVRVVDTMLVAVTDTVTVGDTVYLSLPREVKVYGDSTYTAQVSGYRPALDWIEIYPQREVVTRNIFVYSRKRWGIGLQAGYGAYINAGQVRFAPYVGVGISYDILRW